jgi:hypothetical protein
VTLRSSVLQGVVVAVVILLIFVVLHDVFVRGPSRPDGRDLDDLPPGQVIVFTADLEPAGQLVLKSFHDHEAGSAMSESALAERLGSGSRRVSFLSLVALNFDRDEPLQLSLRSGSIRVELPDGRDLSHLDLSEVTGAGARPDAAIWRSAFGAPPDGSIRLAPRTVRRLVIAFEGAVTLSEVKAVRFRESGVDLAFRRLELPRAEVDAFLDSPHDPLGARGSAIAAPAR